GLAVPGPVSRAPARVGRGRPAAMAPRRAVSHLGLDTARRRPRARPRLRLPSEPAQAGGGRDAWKPDRPTPERPAVPSGRAARVGYVDRLRPRGASSPDRDAALHVRRLHRAGDDGPGG